ncbi:MAG: hypothetical protein JEZ07_05795 [Phycisphaerae bacterium]|nr:hypothetical protein [Phycisphaerae bacterium]
MKNSSKPGSMDKIACLKITSVVLAAGKVVALEVGNGYTIRVDFMVY